jgi:selenium metabolism protein YedF
MKVIDCRGLACPTPVITAKKAIEESCGAPFQILLDNGAARENVLRFCSSKNCTVIETPGDTNTSIIISCNHQTRLTDDLTDKLLSPVILLASDSLGNGSDELGRLLLKNFIITLLEIKKLPEKIIFVNRGVLLTSEGSELIEPLSKLVNAGVEILSCGVCLEYFGLKDKLVTGQVTNMYTIAESMLLSGNTIRL